MPSTSTAASASTTFRPTSARRSWPTSSANGRSGGNPALVIAPHDTDARWEVMGDGPPATVTGPLTQVTAWLAGRPSRDVVTADGGPAPLLPPWL